MLSFSSAPGNLFNVLGSLGGLLKNVYADQALQKAALIDATAGVTAQLAAQPDIQAAVGSAYIGLVNGAGGNYGGVAQQIGQTIVNRLVYQDNPQIAMNLQSLNVSAAVAEVIRQMGVAGASVLAMTVAASPAAVIGTGNGVAVASVKRASDGRVCENAFAETILLQCTADSYTGGATAGNETFTATGAGSALGLFTFDWPQGSNATATLNAVDGSVSNGSGNSLSNSSFDTWAAGLPTGWTLDVGTAGTDISQNTGIVYDYPPNSSLQITGDAGGTLTQLSQLFGSSSGTTATLSPLTQYALNGFIRRDGTAAGAGVLTVELVDTATNLAVQDANGVSNSTTVDLTTLTTSWQSFSLAIRTPRALPAAYALRLRLSTALTSGRSVYVDKIGLGSMTALYSYGPSLAVFAGSVPFVLGDYSDVAVTNGRGAGGTLSTFQTLWYLMFQMPDVLLPSSAAPSISDTLIA